jgi:hypothetical protein
MTAEKLWAALHMAPARPPGPTSLYMMRLSTKYALPLQRGLTDNDIKLPLPHLFENSWLFFIIQISSLFETIADLCILKRKKKPLFGVSYSYRYSQTHLH